MKNEKIKMKNAFKLLMFFVCYFSITGVFAQGARSFDEIFPNLNADKKAASFSEGGLVSYNQKAGGINLLADSSSGISREITNTVMNKNSGYVIESINVFPINNNIGVLDIYNALSNIRSLKGRQYDSYTKGKPTILFEDATRIAGSSNTNAVSDPAPANRIPVIETFYARLKDNNFGNTYYRGEIKPVQNGLSYSLTNFRNITYLFVTVIKQEQFTAQLYIEAIEEGVLIYSIAGVNISDFAASQINIESAIAKRLAVIAGWAQDEITKKVLYK